MNLEGVIWDALRFLTLVAAFGTVAALVKVTVARKPVAIPVELALSYVFLAAFVVATLVELHGQSISILSIALAFAAFVLGVIAVVRTVGESRRQP